MIFQVVNFAEVVLNLVERNDEYILAKADLERAIKLVEELEQMLEDLQSAKEEYENNLQEKQEEYEKAIEEMKAQYENMTAVNLRTIFKLARFHEKSGPVKYFPRVREPEILV